MHGLAEAIERDIHSFDIVRDRSMFVELQTLTGIPALLAEMVLSADFRLYVRYSPNPFGLPYFAATLAEPDARDHLSVSAGYGCHPSASIALVRAICEAAQGRLSFIHGGRDDLTERYERYAHMTPAQEQRVTERLLHRVARQDHPISFTAIPDADSGTRGLASALAYMQRKLADQGMDSICRVVYTNRHDLLQVVRVCVPGLEQFNATTRRFGRRLRDYVRATH